MKHGLVIAPTDGLPMLLAGEEFLVGHIHLDQGLLSEVAQEVDPFCVGS